ncbi:RIP metalloprotease [bacterium]|nr:MAG: RIP metalloprotease [bacterium]
MAQIFLYPLYALVLVTVLSILVAAHEYGHYIFARLFGMGAEEFAIGMGKPRVLTWLRRTYTVPLPADAPYREGEMVSASGGMGFESADKPVQSEVVRTHQGLALAETTEFTVRPWPVGGFVRIKGMMPEEDGSETKIPGGFYSKAPWKRFIVLLAGPAFSVLAGILLLTGLYTTYGSMQSKEEPVIGAVVRDGAAGKAGLKPDDRILALDGKPVARFYDVLTTVREKGGQKIVLTYERNGQRKDVTVVPTLDTAPTPVMDERFEPTTETRVQGKLGLTPMRELKRLSVVQAWSDAWRFPVLTVKGLWTTFTQPSQARENLGGPGTIVAATAAAVNSGFATVIQFAALLSISVGIMNLLPIFPLDGGQMMVAIAEMLRGGKRLSIRVQNLVGTIGFALVVTLFAGVILIDVDRFVFSKFRPKPVEKPIEFDISDKMKDIQR